MAKHPKRRGGRGKGFVVWPVQIQMALSTLATDTVIKFDLLALSQNAFMISADLQWTLRGGVATEGPIQVGYANDDLAVAEIAEAFNAAPASQSDIIQIERSRRPVRKAGSFTGLVTDEALNDGKAIRTTLKFKLANGVDLAVWAFNQSGSALTGSQFIEVTGNVYGRWTS